MSIDLLSYFNYSMFFTNNAMDGIRVFNISIYVTIYIQR